MSAISELAHAAAPAGRGKRCSCSRRAVFACDEPTTIRDLEDEGRAGERACGRPVCDYCVKRSGALDLCQIHARLRNIALTENRPAPAVAAVQAHVGNLYAGDPALERAQRHHENHLRRAGAELPDIEIPDVFAEIEA